ncbi:hypothetical protein B0H63DRAFT_523668 [Podospora didyma]|uniref:Uncharacterized protein n=1 Tax=Podospora didyma TaxID=330526 RepID=A0AAE0NG93_9PEZI|nr:hypothetical protein B0H63DRAFT_523668 [Podospora didyma]
MNANVGNVGQHGQIPAAPGGNGALLATLQTMPGEIRNWYTAGLQGQLRCWTYARPDLRKRHFPTCGPSRRYPTISAARSWRLFTVTCCSAERHYCLRWVRRAVRHSNTDFMVKLHLQIDTEGMRSWEQVLRSLVSNQHGNHLREVIITALTRMVHTEVLPWMDPTQPDLEEIQRVSPRFYTFMRYINQNPQFLPAGPVINDPRLVAYLQAMKNDPGFSPALTGSAALSYEQIRLLATARAKERQFFG